MKLLQNEKNKVDFSISYFHELNLQIESFIELCREGEISVHDVGCIINNEYFSLEKHQRELCEKLEKYEKEDPYKNDFIISPEGYKILGHNGAFSELYKMQLQRNIDILSDYSEFLSRVFDNKIFSEILDADDYKQKRKSKMKTQNYTEYENKETPKQENSTKHEEDNHVFMRIMKTTFPNAYTAMKKAIEINLVKYENNLFNFICAKGCVGLIFNKAGYTEYKNISQYILINGEKPSNNTLVNCTKNTPPKEWTRIEKEIFTDNQ